MTSPEPTYGPTFLHLAYEQQVENVREAKRFQWQLTYLGLVALGALVGADQLLREWRRADICLAARVFTVLGGLVVVAAATLIGRSSRSVQDHRQQLERIAEHLAGHKDYHARFKKLLSIPERYGHHPDFPPMIMAAILCVGAGILAWLLCRSVWVGLGVALITGVMAFVLGWKWE